MASVFSLQNAVSHNYHENFSSEDESDARWRRWLIFGMEQALIGIGRLSNEE